MKRRNFFKKQRAKEYNKGKFNNPYFSNEPSLWQKWRPLVTLLGFILLLIFTFAAIVTSGILRINSITASDIKSATKEEIISIAQTQLNSRRYGLKQSFKPVFNTQALHDELMEAYAFETIQINIDKHNLHIDITERVTGVVWTSGDQYILTDLNGIAIRNLTDEERASIQSRMKPNEPIIESTTLHDQIPIIDHKNPASIETNTKIISPERTQAFIKIDTVARQMQITPLRFRIETPTEAWAEISLPEYYILFTIEDDIKSQLERLQVLIREQEDPAALEYIDLRFGDHVYIK